MTKIKILKSVIGYNLAAAEYDKKEKYLNSFEQNKLMPLLGDLKGKKVLDVGAGTGRLTLLLSKAKADVTALDISQEMLKMLEKKDKTILTKTGDVECLPFEDETFDVVTAAFVIVHLKNPSIFFSEAYRVLKDGGYLAITNINQKEPPAVPTKEGIIKIESFYHRPEKIVEELEELAFKVVKTVFVYEKDVWINQIILLQK